MGPLIVITRAVWNIVLALLSVPWIIYSLGQEQEAAARTLSHSPIDRWGWVP